MAVRMSGGEDFNSSDGGDRNRRLPPGYPDMRPVRPGYRNFVFPPLHDPVSGHNLPLVPEGPVGLFTVLKKQDDSGEVDEEDDCVWCTGRDPSTGQLYTRVPVAKPPYLQRTPWDGYEEDGSTPNGQVFTEDDTVYRYKYINDNAGFRFKEIVASQSFVDELAQDITPAYFADDILTVARAVHRPVSGEPTLTKQGRPIEFVDLNSAGRRWRDDEKTGVCHVIVFNGSGFWARTVATGSFDSWGGLVPSDLDQFYEDYIQARRGTFVFHVGNGDYSGFGFDHLLYKSEEETPSGSIRSRGIRGEYLQLRITTDAIAKRVEWVTLKTPLLLIKTNKVVSVGGQTIFSEPHRPQLSRSFPRQDEWVDFLTDWFGSGASVTSDEFGSFQYTLNDFPMPIGSGMASYPIDPFMEGTLSRPLHYQTATNFLEALWASRDNQ